ncbi:hypothetical protein M427DRAFT_162603 [Gonapodya prolifera JEL478]|uniref:RING-type E3 ubiquitin transferase n=1 Tax=Gonapodya prolifera (strain JEL478) TaxID=1344416 RepID=A0A139AZ78_GONPJ|nr:hypothetical protein M427DRAFT_162603 [Gonapodya prolifera JEL478]|eukprot:KXS22036.1 hypothetical protein M427DRAFT_162603 [Gonapodya prolifera JEL478]
MPIPPSTEWPWVGRISLNFNEILQIPLLFSPDCSYGTSCFYVHGDECTKCGLRILHKFNVEERERHINSSCIQQVSQPTTPSQLSKFHLDAVEFVPDPDFTPSPLPSPKGKELAMAPLSHIPQSSSIAERDIECAICFESVLQQDRIFGLLASCSHPFCLQCIRSWRQISSEKTAIDQVNLRSCPICRQVSFFVVPSRHWPRDEAHKQQTIDSYKFSRSRIPCKHFERSGERRCPFGDECFYSHARSDGSTPQLGPPTVRVDGTHRRIGRRSGASRGLGDNPQSMAALLRHLHAYFGVEGGEDDSYSGYTDDEDEDVSISFRSAIQVCLFIAL